jgi:hypothetical protein
MAEMSSKSRSWYEREVDALRDRVNALTLASDSETAMAMDLIIVAALVGADAVRLAEKTDVPIDKIRPLERRLREAQIWNGRSVDAREWCDMDYFDRILVIFLQAKVALGVVKRAQLDGYAAYTGCQGEELIRFPIPDDSQILCRFARQAVWFDVTSAIALVSKLQPSSRTCSYPSFQPLTSPM